MAALTSDKKLNSKLGWFPFPAVAGGQGDPDVALGGGDGFSCTTEATNACVEFLKYVTGTDVQKELVSSGAAALPVNAAAASAIKDPTVKTVQDFAANASYIQTYFDIALPTSAGQALDDAVANFFAGKGDGRGGIADRQVSERVRHRTRQRRREPARGLPPPAARGRRRRLELALLLGPALVLFVGFVLVPIGVAAYYSLHKWNGFGP